MALIVLTSGAIVYRLASGPSTEPRPVDRPATGVATTLAATTSTGRSGVYYLPPGSESGSVPLMVALHGTGGKGSAMLARLRPIAERERFIVVAPDSVSVAGAWLVARGAQGVGISVRDVCAAGYRREPAIVSAPSAICEARRTS